MTVIWHGDDRGLERRREEQFQSEVKRLAWQRLDGVYVLCFAALVFLLVLGGAAVLFMGRGMGWFHDPERSPLPDKRLLVNVRDDLADKPILDAVFHAADGKVYVARKDGEIHRYDPETELWDTQVPFSSDSLASADLFRLRSGCGSNPLSFENDDCPDQQSLWGVTAGRGLVRYDDDEWKVLVGDRIWSGSGDVPVSGDGALMAAASGDGLWLAMLTLDEGLGIYHRPSRSWIDLPEVLRLELDRDKFNHVVWADGAFWLGGDSTLVAVHADGWRYRKITDGAVLDLDSDGQQVWALLNRACETSTGVCKRLVQVEGWDAPVVFRIDQRNRFRDISLVNTQFAHAVGEKVALAGEGGIVMYDPNLRSWDGLIEEPVYVTAETLAGDGFFAGLNGGVARVDRGQVVERWQLPSEQVVRLVPTSSRSVLALTRSRAVYFCFAGESVEELISPRGTAFDPALFRNALAIGDTIMFSGPRGILFHDVTRRDYQDVPANTATTFVTGGNPVLAAADNHLFVFRTLNNMVEVNNFSIGDVRGGAFRFRERMRAMPAPLRKVRPWGQAALGVISGNDEVHLVERRRVSPLIGRSLSSRDVSRIYDVASTDGKFFMSTGTGVHTYDLSERSWVSRQMPQGRPLVELTDFLKNGLGRDDLGRVYTFGGNDKPLIGGGPELDFSDADLEDVWLDGEDLYLAGNGLVARYSLTARAVQEQWRLPFRGAIRLMGILEGRPFMLVGNRAYWGDQRLLGSGEAVISLFTGGDGLWTRHRVDGRSYLRGFQPGTNRDICLFRRALLPPRVTDIQSVAVINMSRLAVTTNAGLWFYDAEAHSWFEGPADLAKSGGQAFVVQDTLVVTEEVGGRTKMAFAPLVSIQWPDSCSDDRVDLGGTSKIVRAFALNPKGSREMDRLRWLSLDGSINFWDGQNEVQILPPPTLGPVLGDLQSVMPTSQGEDGGLFAAGTGGAWHYDGVRRQWREIDTGIDLAERWFLAPNAGGARIVTKLRDGSFSAGNLTSTATTASMETVYRQGEALTNSASARLLDVQADGTARWIFLFDDRLAFFDPLSRTWRTAIQFEEVSSTRRLLWSGELPVVSSNDDRTWWVGRREEGAPTVFHRYDIQPGETAALDADAILWLLRSDGSLWQAEPGRNGRYDEPTLYRRPLPLDVDGAPAVYQWGDVLVFDQPSGLVAYQNLIDIELAVPERLRQMGTLQSVREFLNRLVIFDGDSLAVVSQLDDRLSVESALDGVERLVFDNTGLPWAQQDGQWRVWRDGAFRQWPADGNDWRLFVTEGAGTIAMANGRVRFYGNREEERLSSDLVETETNALIPVQGVVWSLERTRVRLHRKNDCNGSPCLTVAGEWPFRSGEAMPNVIAVAQANDSRLEVVTAGNGRLIINPDASTIDLVQGTPQPWRPSSVLENEWNNVASSVVTLADGNRVFNPAQTFETDQDGALLVSRPGDVDDLEVLASRGSPRLAPRGSLDVGWLRWSASDLGFVVETPDGPLTLPATRIRSGDRFFFEEIDALLPIGESRWRAANRFGFFQYNQLDTNLNGPRITFKPVAGLEEVQAVPNGFSAAGNLFDSLGNRVAAGASRNDVSIGQLRVSQGADGLRWRWRLPNGNVEDLDVTIGFPWDRDRRGLFFLDGRLVLHHGAGLIYLSSLSGPPLNRSGLNWREVRFWPFAGDDLMIRTDTNWRSYRGGRWVPADDPRQQAVILDHEEWLVRRTEKGPRFMPGKPRASRVRPERRPGGRAVLTWVSGPAGSGFAADQLREAAIENNLLFVHSEEGLDVYEATRSLSLVDSKPLSGNTAELSMRRTIDGARSVFRRTTDGRVERWQQGQFAETKLPNAEVLLQNGYLRFTREPNGRIVKNLLVKNPEGMAWQPFSFRQGRFPFDRVTAIEAFGSRLFIGTEMCVLVFQDQITGSLDQCEVIYGVDGPVTRIGREPGEKDRIVVETSAGRFEMNALGQRQDKRNPRPLGARLRVDDSLWQWTMDASGSLRGRYRDGRLAFLNKDVDFRGGRPNHDRIRDLVMVDGEAHFLWQEGFLESHRLDSVRLTDAFSIFDLRSYQPRSFVRIEQDKITSEAVVPAGLYLSVSNGILRYDDRQWVPVNDPIQVQLITDHARNPPIYHRRDLRIQRPAAGQNFQFEYRTTDNQWKSLRWTPNGRLQIDDWNALGTSGGVLWAASEGGVLQLEIDAAGRPHLNPNKLNLIESLGSGLDMKRVTDIRQIGSQLMLRVDNDSAKVFQATLGGDRPPTVVPWRGSDPFANRLAIGGAGDFWQWEERGRQRGERGALKITVGGEEAVLSDGTFATDDVESLALLDDRLYLVTRNGGLYQLPKGNLHLREQQRPGFAEIEADRVRGVAATRRGSETLLLLSMQDGQHLRYRPGQSPESVAERAELLADDGFWLYERTDDGLRIRTERSTGGSAARELREGRFTDDRLLGPPISVNTPEGQRYFLPTDAGVLELDDTFFTVRLHAPPFPGMEGNQAPAVLYWPGGEEGPVYLAGANLYQLSGNRDRITAAPLALVDGIEPIGMTRGAHNTIELTWLSDDGLGWNLLTEGDYGTRQAMVRYLNARGLAAFASRRLAWGDPDPWLRLEYDAYGLSIARADGNRQDYRLEISGLANLKRTMLLDDKLLLITSDELHQINLTPAIQYLYSQK